MLCTLYKKEDALVSRLPRLIVTPNLNELKMMSESVTLHVMDNIQFLGIVRIPGTKKACCLL
jgi:hypothetical protein